MGVDAGWYVGRIAIASDHGGWELKDTLTQRLRDAGHVVEDLGGDAGAVDYPEPAALVARQILAGDVEFGILICGSGIGVCIAANRVPGIRAATLSEPVSARLSRAHNHANVACLGARLIGVEMAWAIVQTFLATEGEPGRHGRRVAMLDAMNDAVSLEK